MDQLNSITTRPYTVVLLTDSGQDGASTCFYSRSTAMSENILDQPENCQDLLNSVQDQYDIIMNGSLSDPDIDDLTRPSGSFCNRAKPVSRPKYTCRDLYFNMLDTHSNSVIAKQLKMREARLEKYLKDYVYDKTGESVYLHLEDAIMISHVTRRGSITLAILWANVLQHPDNFPPERFTYNKYYDSPTGGDRLLLKAEGAIFTVFMASGSLVIEGRHIYDWFVKRFHELLDNYDPSFQNTWTFIPTASMAVGDNLPDPEKYIPQTETERYLALQTTRHAEGTPLDRRMAEHADDLIPGLGNMNIDQTLFEGPELVEEVESLVCGGLRDGLSYIYKLWRSLLSKWLSDPDTLTYVITPQLDGARMQDIVSISLAHQYKGRLEALYTNMDCNGRNGQNIEDVKKYALRAVDDKYRTFVDYKVLNRVMLPMKRVNARMMAGVKDGQAEVLVTSAGFHGDSFLFENMESVMVTRMEEDRFLAEYIKPIESPVVASTY